MSYLWTAVGGILKYIHRDEEQFAKIDHSNVLYLFIRSCLTETRGGARQLII